MTEANIIDGKALAERLRERVVAAAGRLREKHGLQPGLAVILVGEDPASQVYVRNKAKQTVACGLRSFEHNLPLHTTEGALLSLIKELNADDRVNGILVQLPLPDQIDQNAVVDAVHPQKDVDGFHIVNIGRLITGGAAMVPCTPLGCLMMLRDQLGDLAGKEAVIVGRSNIVGKPMAQLLLSSNCTVTVAHSRTQALADVCRRADILVAAVGRPEMIRGDWIKPGATVIDVGINRIQAGDSGKSRLVGDVAFEEAAAVAGAITPVPGGVGPMTIAVLLRNAVVATYRQAGLMEPEIWPP